MAEVQAYLTEEGSNLISFSGPIAKTIERNDSALNKEKEVFDEI